MSYVPQQPPPLPSLPATFSGARSEFFRLVSRGAAIELITLGFYRFWLATDIRRHLWVNTAVDGDAAEYTGRGKELLIGFLFAMAILVPIYLAYFLITVEAERFKAFASVPLLISFYAFGQFAIYRARRYRLTRTVWRGIRFWMDGSGWAYAGRAMLWTLLAVVTLGIAWPWRTAALERYKMRHSHYGNLQGDFEGRGWELFKQVWYLWLIAPFAMVLFPLYPFVYAQLKAVEWRWWVSGIRFGGVRLDSTLPNSAFYGLYWKIIGWMMLLVVVFVLYVVGAFALVATLLGGGTGAKQMQAVANHIGLLVPLGIGYVAIILAANVVMRLYLVRDVWATVLASVQVHGIEAMADVAAKGDLASALGEGFADGLDVAGF
nr:YjgN family protein [Bradyrhizobium sp. SRS-191]